tara:strand:- start:42352 stop:46671 length:4320 start_codon:yes stop_codon:yes gene_type:complete
MSCNVKIKLKNHLIEQDIISEDLKIRNTRAFDEYSRVIDELAVSEYAVQGPSPILTKVGDRVDFNDDLIKILEMSMTRDEQSQTLAHVTKNYEDLKAGVITQEEAKDTPPIFTYKSHMDFILKQDIEEVKKTPAEFMLFGNIPADSTKRLSASELLNNIIHNYSGFSKESAFIVDNIQKIASRTNTTVKLVTSKELNETTSGNAFMAYSIKMDEIYISPVEVRKMEAKGDTDFIMHAFLHEVVHSLTVDAFKYPQNTKEEMFRDFITEQHKKYMLAEMRPELMTDADGWYGLTNPLEFMAEMISNAEFRAHIEGQEETKNMFDLFVDWVRRILGVKVTKTNNEIVKTILEMARPMEEEGIYANDFFNIERREKEQMAHEDLLIDDSTLEKSLVNTITKLNVSLDASIKSLQRRLDFSDDTNKDSYYKDQINSLQQVRRDLSDINLGNQILAVEGFLSAMIGNMEIIKKAVKKVDTADEAYIMSAVKSYDKVLAAYSIIEEVQEMIAAIEAEDHQAFISVEELNKLRLYAENATGRYSSVRKDVDKLMKKGMVLKLNNIKYFKEVETQHINRLVKEHRESGIIEDRDQWVIKTMANRDKARIDEDVLEAVNKLINNKAWDIFGSDVTFSSALNVSSPLIQVFNTIITEVDQARNKERIAKDVVFEQLYKKLVEEKGTNDVNKIYENITQQDSNGKWHIKGEYDAKFMSEVYDKIQQVRYDRAQATADFNIEILKHKLGSPEYTKLHNEYKQMVLDANAKIKGLEAGNVVKLDKGGKGIAAKWKNTFKLSPIEQEVLDFFKELQDDILNMTQPGEAGSNVKHAYKGKFYELPKVTKTDTERFFGGDIKGMAQDKIKDLAKLRPDDFGYSERFTDLSGRQIRALKLWYRDPSGTFDNTDQSLDLMGIMRMDFVNASAHQIRGEFEQELNFLLDIAQTKEYYSKEGTIPVVSKLFKKYDVISGENSNTVKMMNNMLESKFYDILNKGGYRIGSVDANKAVTFINNASAFLTLSLNLASGTANVVNANAQLFIESFFKGRFITAGSIAKSNKIYAATLGDSLADLTRPVARGFVNQLQEYFNTKGLHQLSDTNFVQTDLMKVGLSAESLRVFQESGEHYIQSVTVMAVMDGIKVMDENHNFINKDGKIVKTKKAAASLLDMMKVDEVVGTVDISPNVVYTTHNKLTKWTEGGKENVDALLAKKLYDIIGNYRASDQSDITRSWHGKLIMLYRKFLVPMGQARLRGIETMGKRKEDLQDYEKRYSYALQEYDEGYYTTFLRYVITSAKDKKMYLMTKDKVWDKLSEHEKHNIKKFVVESVMTMAILPLVVQLITSLQGNDDEEVIYFLLYQIRRLETELSSYKNPSETFKMMRSPIPSMRLIETSLSIVLDTFQPWKWSDEYMAGANKGKSKFGTRIKKQIPVIKEFQRTYKDLFEYQNSYFGFK